jgi:hypothetical protein
MHNFTDNIPTLKIETNEDGTITLEQDWCGNAERVAVHTVHVRHLAERLGMIREVSASDAELLRTERGHVASLRQENDRLKRNMLRLREHALTLQRDFAEHADWKHADLVPEMNAINAVVSLFDMAVDDFADDYDAHEPCRNPRVSKQEPSGYDPTQPIGTAPKADGFEAPPKTGGFGDAVAVTPSHTKQRQSGPTANGLGARTAPGARSAGGAPSAPPQEMHPRSSGGSKPLQLKLEGAHGQ